MPAVSPCLNTQVAYQLPVQTHLELSTVNLYYDLYLHTVAIFIILTRNAIYGGGWMCLTPQTAVYTCLCTCAGGAADHPHMLTEVVATVSHSFHNVNLM